MPEPPVARSPIEPTPPTEVRDGWVLSARESAAGLQLADRTPLTKVLVRADVRGRLASTLAVRFGRARADTYGTLVVGCGIGEWLLLAPPGSLPALVSRLDSSDEGLVSVVDVTHGRALMRISGSDAPRVLSKVCAIDFADRVTPHGAVFRSSVAKVATEVIRDDRHDSDTTERSYLLHCERSLGQYLFDALLDAGREFGIEHAGFVPDRFYAAS
jgi:sarcosine oxidase, subunit alpha